MATIGKWRLGNTRRGILFPLNLGTDPVTGTPREIEGTDEVTMIMRCRTSSSPTALVRTVTVLNDGPYTINGTEYDQACWWKPEDGDFDEAGTYDVVFDLTDSDDDVETIPSDAAEDYQFEVDLKPGDSGYVAG